MILFSAIRKRFDKELYDQCDSKAKSKAIRLVRRVKGFKARENEKKRGVDLIVSENGEDSFYIETEIKKRKWKGDKFPFPDINFPERKRKFAELDKPTLFIMFNEDLSSYLVVTSKDLLESEVKEVPNKYVFKGEKFFKVPTKKVYFNDLKGAIESL